MKLVRTRSTIDNRGAEAVIAAAEKFANAKGYRVFVAVVDPAGELIAMRHTDGAQVASARVAVDKARTAAIFVRPSRVLEEQVTEGRLGALALHGGSALIGGIPLVVNGEVVGAIGTSGETPDQDEAVSIAGAKAKFPSVEIPALTYEGAKLAAEAAGAIATSREVWPVVSVVDAWGELVYLWRPDLAQPASVNVATDKARTAAIYRRPSKDFEDQASGGRPSALHLARSVPLQGGIPLVQAGHVIGAAGVSGASSADEDQELALAGVAAFSAAGASNGNGNGAAHISGAELQKRFRKGGVLLDAGGYKLDAGRRDAPGEVEYHEKVTDVMHVVQGRATVVTGGSMVGAREVAPGERRARSIKGGTTHTLAEGDVFAVPQGVPHQFVDVSDPFLYFVVKVEG